MQKFCYEAIETSSPAAFGAEFALAVGGVSLSDILVANGNLEDNVLSIDQYRLVPIGPKPDWWSGSAALGYESAMPNWVTVEKYEYDDFEGRNVAWPDVHVDGHAGVGITYRAIESGRQDDVLIAIGSVIDPRQTGTATIEGRPTLLEVVQLQGTVRDAEQPELTHGLHAIDWQGTLLAAIEAASTETGITTLRVNPNIPHGDAATTGRIRSSYKRAASRRNYQPTQEPGHTWIKHLGGRDTSQSPELSGNQLLVPVRVP